jgi:hypothetical protein
MGLDWSILRSDGPVDIAGNFARGYQIGSAIIDKYHERNALAALAQQPNDPRALSMLYQVNPQMGAHFEARGTQLQATQRQATLGAQYASGDTRGAEVAAMSAGDFDLAKQFQTLDESKVKTAADFWEKAGPIAYKLKQTADPAQRQALWQQAKPILQSEGIDQSKLDQFDPTNDQQLDAAIVMSQKVSDLVNQGKIEWHQQGENPSFATDAMGHPIGSANPATVAVGGNPAPANLPTVTDTKSYEAVPPGGHYLDPAGHMRVKGGQSAAPAGGFSMTNNPGALRVPGSMKFQSFSSPQEGIQAQQALLGRYMGRGLRNVSSIVEHYAPRQSRGGDNSDASVNNYIGYVARRLGVNPQDTLADAMLPRLAQAMREFETGRRAD